MDVRLGVAVEAASARLALLEDSSPHTVIDRSQLDLTGDPVEALMSTVVSTDRMLTEAGHRLTGTSVYSPDAETAARIRDVLADAQMTGVTVVSRSEAITEATRSVVGDTTAASLVSDAETAALSIVDAGADTTSLIAVEPIVDGDRGAAYRTLLQRLGEEPGGATSVIVLDAPVDDAVTDSLVRTSPVPLRFLDEPDFALAHGAALAAIRRRPNAGVAAPYDDSHLDSAPTEVSPHAQQLAYSQVDSADDMAYASPPVSMQMPMQPLSAFGGYDQEEVEVDEDDTAERRPRTLLLGSTIAALVVVGFATLAVSVALNIRPDVDRQTVRLAEESIDGKYFPTAPGQGVQPDGPAWAMVEEVPPAGDVPDARTFRPQVLNAAYNTGDTGAAEVVKFYRDGTVGVIPDGVPLVTPPPVDPGFGVPEPAAYVTRLIPDFSRWSPCQVLSLVSNMRLMTQAAADVATSGLNTRGPIMDPIPFSGPTLDDLGPVAVVPVGQGNLFNPARENTKTGTDVGAIPDEIFMTSGKQNVASNVLPEGTKIIDTAALSPTPASSGPHTAPSAPALGEFLTPEVSESLPGITGTAPIEGPVIGTPAPDAVTPAIEVNSEGLPGGSLPEVRLPGTSPLPGGPATVGGPGIKSAEPALPIGDAPSLKGIPGPKLDVPAPEVNLPAPKVEVPRPKIEVPAPEVNLPAPKVEVPAPKVEIPAPEVNIPAPEVNIPVPEPPVFEPPAIEAPVIEAPTAPIIEIPTQLIPAPSAPKIELPSAPEAPSLPALPQLPTLGELFN